MFIDVHCHLDMLDDIRRAIDRAKKEGVELIITQGTNSQSNNRALEISKKFPQVLAALGLYPTDSLPLSDEDVEALISEIKTNKKRVVAIGEVGLDLKEIKELDKQAIVFGKMINLALGLDKPIIVHSRKAEKECIEMLEQAGAKKVIMHCFSGKLSLVRRIIDNGWQLSIPTSVKNSEHFQKVIEMTPIENLLCETDSPYLHPDRMYPNEPANVVASYEMIAKIKKLKLKDVEKRVEDNYRKLFG